MRRIIVVNVGSATQTQRSGRVREHAAEEKKTVNTCRNCRLQERVQCTVYELMEGRCVGSMFAWLEYVDNKIVYMVNVV